MRTNMRQRNSLKNNKKPEMETRQAIEDVREAVPTRTMTDRIMIPKIAHLCICPFSERSRVADIVVSKRMNRKSRVVSIICTRSNEEKPNASHATVVTLTSTGRTAADKINIFSRSDKINFSWAKYNPHISGNKRTRYAPRS